MRTFAPVAIIGSLLLVAGLEAQSLTENAAAIAGATIGTAAGKPLGTALGNIFGKIDKDTDKAANAKTAKTPKTAKTNQEQKVEKPEPETVTAKQSGSTPSFSGSSPAGPGPMGEARGGSGSSGNSSRNVYRTEAAPSSFVPAAQFAPAAPVEPVVRQLSAADLANLRVGSSGQEMQAALGVPESRVIIPGDDGRLLESCQYWSNGQHVGTVHLVNGQVVSVASRSTN
ncbi:MAG TPA: hypothetical protein VMH80_19275 [Bryobacteraceae bacterium]|nr:hypothetical protein [Bryobacteraceae bacterium]